MSKIMSFIAGNGMLAVFIIIMMEYACFPVSSEIVLPFAGAIAQNSHTPYILLLFISIPAGIIGSLICYVLGYIGGHRLITWLTRKFPATTKGIDYSYSFFDRHGKFAVCAGRLIPLCRTYISFIAGATRQPICDFIFFSFAGITVWNSVLIGLGYILGANWIRVAGFYSTYKTIIIPILIFIVAYILLRRIPYFRQK